MEAGAGPSPYGIFGSGLFFGGRFADWMFDHGGVAPHEPQFDPGPDLTGFAHEAVASEAGAKFEWSPDQPMMTEGIDDLIIVDGWMGGFVTNSMNDGGGDIVDDVILIGIRDRDNPEIWNPHDGPVPGNGGGMGGGGQGSGGGYRGGATPEGFTPHEDGTGRFMYDREGNLYVNPNYRDWLQHNDQRIDWVGVAADFARIIGPAYGAIAVGALRAAIGAGIGAIGEWVATQNRP